MTRPSKIAVRPLCSGAPPIEILARRGTPFICSADALGQGRADIDPDPLGSLDGPAPTDCPESTTGFGRWCVSV
jgi:hypothetical protein